MWIHLMQQAVQFKNIKMANFLMTVLPQISKENHNLKMG